MKRTLKPTLTEQASRALQEAVTKVLEDHRQRGRPLALWRDGKAVWVPVEEVTVLRACFKIVGADVRRLKPPFKNVHSPEIRASLRRLLQ